jgi:hypothetical protein
MLSRYVRQEWEYATSLKRPAFVRPVYWEEPLPEVPAEDLPPETLRRLHFARIYPSAWEPPPPPARPVAPPAAAPPITAPTESPGWGSAPTPTAPHPAGSYPTAVGGDWLDAAPAPSPDSARRRGRKGGVFTAAAIAVLAGACTTAALVLTVPLSDGDAGAAPGGDGEAGLAVLAMVAIGVLAGIGLAAALFLIRRARRRSR